jgi:hypothetical protein
MYLFYYYSEAVAEASLVENHLEGNELIPDT